MLSASVALLVLSAVFDHGTQDPSVAELTRALAGDVASRTAAAEALGACGAAASPAVPALTVVLGDPDPAIRRRAAWALGRIGPQAKTAVQALGDALTDDGAQHFAAAALGRIGPDAKATVPALVQALRVRNRGLRDIVALALGKIGPEAATMAVPAILWAMGSRDDLCNVNGWALDHPSDPSTFAALVELLFRDPGPCLAWQTDDDHGSSEFARFQDGLEQIEWMPVSSRALCELGPTAIPPIIECLERPLLLAVEVDSDAGFRCEVQTIFAMRALIPFGPRAKPAVPALLELVKDDRCIWGDDVATVLVAIGPDAIPEPAHLAEHGSRELREWSRAVLGELRAALGRGDVPALREIIRRSDADARSWARTMLSDIESRRGH